MSCERSCDSSDSGGEGDHRNRQIGENDHGGVEERLKHSDHSHGRSSVPRTRDVKDSGNKDALEVKHDEKRERLHVRTEREHQVTDNTIGGGSISRKRSQSGRSPQHSAKMRGNSDSNDPRETRGEPRDTDTERRSDVGFSDEGSSRAGKRGYSSSSLTQSPEKKRKYSGTCEPRRDNETRGEPRDTNKEKLVLDDEEMAEKLGNSSSTSPYSPEKRETRDEPRDTDTKRRSDVGFSDEGSSRAGKRGYSSSSLTQSPEKKRKYSGTCEPRRDIETRGEPRDTNNEQLVLDDEERAEKLGNSSSTSPYSPEKRETRGEPRDTDTERRSDVGFSDEGSSRAGKRGYSSSSLTQSPEKKRKYSGTCEPRRDNETRGEPRDGSETVTDEKRDKHSERNEAKESSRGSSSSSRKRSHSPESKGSNTSGRFRIPKKKTQPEDLRNKLEKKSNRQEAGGSHDTSSKSRDVPKERPITSSHLKKEIKDLLRTEHHHLMNKGRQDSNGDYQGVEWCYKYLDPTIRGHITGGRAILHHRCRQCNRICLHLLGTYGTGKRMCLACAARERGWREKEVPSWYFHESRECSNCRNDTRRDHSFYGSYYR